MNALKLLGYDIKYGIFKRWYIFLIAIVFAVAEYRASLMMIKSLNESELMYGNGTVMDYILYSFQGMPVYNFSPQNYFTIPLFWFVFQIGASYIVAYYTENDLKKNGRNILLASKSRIIWWLSKVVTCVSSVFLYYILTISLIVILAVMSGASLSIEASYDFCTAMFSPTIQYLSTNDLIYIVLILPFVVTTAICICQVTCSLVCSPVVCFATVSGMYVLSAYYTMPWFLGNYTMWQRCSYYAEGGVSPDAGLFLALVIFVLSIVGGSYVIKTKDVF